LTTGTWPSPFFLLWVDSIWRGMVDTHVPTWPLLNGLTGRQRWQVWRECVVDVLIVGRAELFPISRLMVHGAVLASHGDALANGLHNREKFDWAQEVWSLAAMGLQLQELYISAKFMDNSAWDELASALKWARANWQILEDAHFATPTACMAASDQKSKQEKFKPYAIAAYRPPAPGEAEANTSKGFVFWRNPRKLKQKSSKVSLAKLLELPEDLAKSWLRLSLVRQVGEKIDKQEGAALDCNSFGALATRLHGGRCEVPADAKLKLSMSPGEVLVLQVEVQPSDENARMEL